MAEVLTPDNIAGLVVGEGCFYAESCKDPKYRLGWRVRPAFCIEMRADETEVLEAVRDELGCGAVYHLDFGRYRGYETRGWVPHAKYRVGRLDDLNGKVVPYFQAHRLFGRKAQAFGYFSDLVGMLKQGMHRSPDGLEKVKEVASMLKAHNRRGLQT